MAREIERWVTWKGRRIPIYKDTGEVKSLEEKAKGINPNFKKDASIYDKEGYNNNCVQCAIAVEAMLRGEDVEANPFKFGDSDTLHKSKSPAEAFGTKMSRDGWEVSGNRDKVIEDIEYFMKEDFGEGSRAIYQSSSPTSKHTINIINDGGKIIFIDGQNGIIGSGKKVMAGMKTFHGEILRVDDKEIDPEYANWAYRRRK